MTTVEQTPPPEASVVDLTAEPPPVMQRMTAALAAGTMPAKLRGPGDDIAKLIADLAEELRCAPRIRDARPYATLLGLAIEDLQRIVGSDDDLDEHSGYDSGPIYAAYGGFLDRLAGKHPNLVIVPRDEADDPWTAA